MDHAMIIFTRLGEQGLIWIMIALLLLIKRSTRHVSLMVMAALILNAVLGELILKNIFQRSRPFTDTTSYNLLIPKPLSYSFPSGHTASSFAAAGVLAKYFKRYSAILIILASLIAFSRLYLYVHYPTDVLGGILLGLSSSILTIRFFSKTGSAERNGD
jgi:undecaprenyl-diphosphatase